MARVFDVVEYPSEMLDEIVHRFPETGVADLRMGSQVIVREVSKGCLLPGWKSAGRVRPRAAYHYHCKYSDLD